MESSTCGILHLMDILLLLCVPLYGTHCAHLHVPDTFFKNMGLLTEIAAFLYLKHMRPNAHRVYEVPGVLCCVGTFRYGKRAPRNPVLPCYVHRFTCRGRQDLRCLACQPAHDQRRRLFSVRHWVDKYVWVMTAPTCRAGFRNALSTRVRVYFGNMMC